MGGWTVFCFSRSRRGVTRRGAALRWRWSLEGKGGPLGSSARGNRWLVVNWLCRKLGRDDRSGVVFVYLLGGPPALKIGSTFQCVDGAASDWKKFNTLPVLSVPDGPPKGSKGAQSFNRNRNWWGAGHEGSRCTNRANPTYCPPCSSTTDIRGAPRVSFSLLRASPALLQQSLQLYVPPRLHPPPHNTLTTPQCPHARCVQIEDATVTLD
jgi:hypothetical protein